MIKADRGIRWLGRAHPTSYVIAGAVLGGIVDRGELARSSDTPWPSTALLLARPEPEELAKSDSGQLLVKLWRRLLRARVEADVKRSFEAGTIDATGLAERIEMIGRTEFEEALASLKQDGLLLPPISDQAGYAVFASVFIELMHFEPMALSIVFPAIEHPAEIEKVLARDLDARILLNETRPSGAPDHALRVDTDQPSNYEAGTTANSLRVHRHSRLGLRFRRVAVRARLASERGNTVKAAILWTQSALAAGPDAGEAERAAARAAIRRLAIRLQKALFVQKGEASLWVEALTPLLPRAAVGFWSPERRLLHDLQNVCLDHEREVFRLEPIGWLYSLGRRPLKHPLPHLREVSMARHLRTAAKRLRRVRLSHDSRVRLDGLLHPAGHHAEVVLRDRFRPAIESTLKTAGVEPANLPERVAYHKLVEELIDPIVARGFTSLGDLRDSVSRGNLKARDVSGPSEFLRGDRLLQTDRRLSEVLDGVHRRGEVYLRWLQRFSALAFGTPIGRFLTRFVAIPFGGTFVLLKGVEEIDELTLARLTGHHLHLVNTESILVIGFLAMGIINSARLRHASLGLVRVIGRALRCVLVEWPIRLLNHPLLRRLIGSVVVQTAWRFLIKPGLVTAPVWALVSFSGYTPLTVNVVGVSTFVAACLMLNTNVGRTLEEIVSEQISHVWRGLIFEVIPGVFRIILSVFARILEWVERFLYAVDEWLRFREGQARGMIALKVVVGLIWGVFAYAIRIYVNLLIEPQINPIKHFPVVTVAAKIVLPFALTLTRIFAAPLIPLLGDWVGNSIAGTTVFFLPGVFGFLVWEFRSNWKLYEANRPASLIPVAVGSHGETIVRFLRPGFHSGTLPKRFARLRRALRVGREPAILKHREALHHVEESVRQLVEREFAGLLHENLLLRNWSIGPGSIHLATNRIRIEVLARERDSASLWIDLEERSGVLFAGISQTGWLEELNSEQRRALADAVAGLYRISGIERVHTPGDDVSIHPVSQDQLVGSAASDHPIAFADVMIPWKVWVEVWEGQADKPGWRMGILPEDGKSRRTSRIG